ncbi:MAG: glucose-6-phosphate dehydrogenase [Bacteroides sp.]|nr:glucose-6-phosphate dehydrogenase [Roseburia sp.]MCM1345640.1 glucose-6-phosphate dehydrogenase [Bacteroides sp.]MCM1420944.1 glucose-6-phosphate dehydrogenase [Bacteroides sp.]
MKQAKDQMFVIFGASGDLTRRKLMPSLYKLHLRGMLPTRFCILGVGRTPYDNHSFRAEQTEHIRAALAEQSVDDRQLEAFAGHLYYVSIDPTDKEQYGLLGDTVKRLQKTVGLPDNIVFYLATPPFMYETISECIRLAGMNVPGAGGWRRMVVEKPFGTSLSTAEKLNAHLLRIFDEKDIFRIDHFLGKETVQNILALRFSNGIFEPLWNRNYIDSVEIHAAESLGVGTRGGYYDASGALRDMVQNHLMQLMGFVAMEPPSAFDAETIRDEVCKVLRSLRLYASHEIDDFVVRGQYVGYRGEPNVNPLSETETYIAMKVFIDNWRWSGVPFYFVTGKAMSEKTSEVVVNFRSTPHRLFAGQCAGNSCNKLLIRIQPDESITLMFGLKEPGNGFTVRQVAMKFDYDSLNGVRLPDAYERLLMDAMSGDSTLYARSDALEASWRFVEPITEHWKKMGGVGLYPYNKGEDGPPEREKIGVQTAACHEC